MSDAEVLTVVPRGGAITVRPDAEQWETWVRVAGDTPLDQWLSQLADEACVDDATDRVWPATIRLTHPVKFGDDTITSIEMRQGKVGDLKGMRIEGGGIVGDQVILLASRLAGQPLKVIEGLHVADAGEVMAIALGFYRSIFGGRKRSR